MKFSFPSIINQPKNNWVITDNHLLAGNVTQISTPNMGSEIELTKLPLYIVLHYTATTDAGSANAILCDKDKEVSAHLVIGRDGKVWQLVPFNRIAWHAGESAWEGLNGLNKCSIGIELVNAGKLAREDGRFLTWDGKRISKREVIKIVHENGFITYWQHYPRKQLEILEIIINSLKSRYTISDILMHSEISPNRKIDPGEAFPIERFRD